MNIEVEPSTRVEAEILSDVLKCEPRPVELFVPDNAEQQRNLFLNGQTSQPQHTYNKLELVDLDLRLDKLTELLEEVTQSMIEEKIKDTYFYCIKKFIEITRYLKLLQDFHRSNQEQKDELTETIKRSNSVLWGEVDTKTYQSLVSDVRSAAAAKTFQDHKAQDLQSELLNMLPQYEERLERFIPSSDTIASISHTVETLYGDLFSHMPDKDDFTMPEVADIFRTILQGEFGVATEAWRVEITNIASIKVVASQKIIEIPDSERIVTRDSLKGLIAHEIGVHVIRAVMAEETDTKLLQVGLPGYDDSEEGLGKVMEQGVTGQYKDSGVPYYLIAGLNQSDNKNFKETYEVMWRYDYLLTLGTSDEVNEASIKKSQLKTYKQLIRMYRGTDQTVWSKDLAYFNGSEKMWRYMEQYSGDALGVTLSLLGKADPTISSHRGVLLESRSV